ncbi:MAG: hypothetical protein R3B54_14440, partial [Bdellovibrionota bacterium]
MLSRKKDFTRILVGYAAVLSVVICAPSPAMTICELANKAIAGEKMTGEQKFQLAQALKNSSHPIQDQNGGTRIEIAGRDDAAREKILNSVIGELQKFYRLEGTYAP